MKREPREICSEEKGREDQREDKQAHAHEKQLHPKEVLWCVYVYGRGVWVCMSASIVDNIYSPYSISSPSLYSLAAASYHDDV
jgi:hypothetical protein